MGTIECSQPTSKSSWESQDFGDIGMVLKMAHLRKSTGPRWVNGIFSFKNMFLKWRPFCLSLNVLREGGYRSNEYIISVLLDLWNIKGHPILSSSLIILTSLCIQVFNLVSAKRQEIMVNVLWHSHTAVISDRLLPCATRLFSVAKLFTECYSCLFFGSIRLYLHFYHVPILTWRRYLKPFLLEYKIHLLYIVNTAAI